MMTEELSEISATASKNCLIFKNRFFASNYMRETRKCISNICEEVFCVSRNADCIVQSSDLLVLRSLDDFSLRFTRLQRKTFKESFIHVSELKNYAIEGEGMTFLIPHTSNFYYDTKMILISGHCHGL